MKNFITITLLLLGLYAHSQVATLPAGSKPLSAQVFIDPDEKLWVGVDGKYYAVEGSGGGGGTGTVTAVGLSAPTGLTVTNSPVTSSGTIALTYSPGYQGFTTAESNKLAGIATGANNYTLPTATATVKGGIELFSNTVQPVAANAVTTAAGRTYGIQLNSAGQAVVNVPWTGGEGGSQLGSTSIYLNTNSFEREALTGDVTAARNSNTTTIANSAVTTAKIANSAVTNSKLSSGSVTPAKFASFASGTYPNGAIVAWGPSSSIQTASYFAFQPYFWVSGGNIGINNFTTSLAGLVPPPGSGSNTRALMANGTWAEVSGGGGISALTGDVLASGTGSVAATIANNAVTLAKIQNIPTKTLIGRYSTGTGVAQTISIGSGLSLNTSTGELSATGGGGGNSTGTTSTTINMSGPRFQRLGARSSNTTLTLTNNSDGKEVQVSLNNTSGSTISIGVSGANAVSDILVPPGASAVVSISNFGGGLTFYAVTSY